MEPSWVLHAKAHDDYIEIKYMKFGFRESTDFLYTEPVGGWTELDFEREECRYTAFLEAMVHQNVEVNRKLARLYLDTVPDKHSVRCMNAMCLLDDTFTPPYINLYCGWQKTLMKNIINSSYDVIANCRSEYRLRRYVSAVKAIQ